MSETEKHVSKIALEKLLRAADHVETAIGEQRQALGDKMNKEPLLNRWAYRVVRQLYKRDPVKAAHDIRALKLYIDLLGLEAQSDLEDLIEAERALDYVKNVDIGSPPKGKAA